MVTPEQAALATTISRRDLAERVRNLPPDMIFDIALGVEDDLDVAERFGFTAEEYASIEKLKSFQIQVKKVRGDLEKNGDMFRAKARIMAEKVMDSGFARAIDTGTPLKETTEFLKTVANMADLMPKQTQGPAGPGFSITIQLPEMDAITLENLSKAKKNAMDTIEGKAEVVEEAAVIEIPDFEEKDNDGEEGHAGAGSRADGASADGGDDRSGAERD